MAENNHDSFSSDLLCMESNSVCFEFDDHDSLPIDEYSYQSYVNENLISGNDIPESFINLPSLNEESLAMMVERENQHSPQADYLKKLRSADDLFLSMRIEAFNWIWKVHSHFGFEVVSFCLSITYLDRFLSVYEQNNISKTWTAQLLALTCLSLAIKMEEINIPWPVELQVAGRNIFFGGESIQRMELHVMDKLMWRMHSCTPCTFIHYFLRKFNGDRQITSGPLVFRSMQLIAFTMKGIDFLEFKPSEVATAVALFVSREMQSIINLDEALSSCFTQEAPKKRVMKCYEMIKDLAANLGNELVTSGLINPNWVLEDGCFIYPTVQRSISSHTDTSPSNQRMREDKTNSTVRSREESSGSNV